MRTICKVVVFMAALITTYVGTMVVCDTTKGGKPKDPIAEKK